MPSSGWAGRGRTAGGGDPGAAGAGQGGGSSWGGTFGGYKGSGRGPPRSVVQVCAPFPVAAAVALPTAARAPALVCGVAGTQDHVAFTLGGDAPAHGKCLQGEFQRGSECAPSVLQARAGHRPRDCGNAGPTFGWSQVAAPAQGPYARRGPRRPRARVDVPTPTALLSPHALPQRPEGRSSAGPGLLCDQVWSAALRSEGNSERGRRGCCRLPRSGALRLLGAVAPWGSSRRCYASLWALFPQQAFPFHNSFTAVNVRGPKWEVERGQAGWVDR